MEFPRKEKLGFTELLQKGVENAFCSFKTQQVSIPYQTVRSEQTVNIRFTTWLTPQINQLITDLSKEKNITKRSVVEDAVVCYYNTHSNRRTTSDLDLLRKQLNKIQEQNERLLNIVQNLCVALGYDTANKE